MITWFVICSLCNQELSIQMVESDPKEYGQYDNTFIDPRNDSEWSFSFTHSNFSSWILFCSFISCTCYILRLDPKIRILPAPVLERKKWLSYIGTKTRPPRGARAFDNQSLNINSISNQTARERKHISKHFLRLPEWGSCTLDMSVCIFFFFFVILFSLWTRQVKPLGQEMSDYKKGTAQTHKPITRCINLKRGTVNTSPLPSNQPITPSLNRTSQSPQSLAKQTARALLPH